MTEEGTVGHWYRDVLNVWTIGVGHIGDPDAELTDVEMRTLPYSRGTQVRPGRHLSHDEMADLLERDVPHYVGPVNQALRVQVPQPVFNQLVSFAFNWGVSLTTGFPATSVLERVNAGDMEGAAQELETGRGPTGRPYNKGLAGVQARREREATVLRAYAGVSPTGLAPAVFVAMLA